MKHRGWNQETLSVWIAVTVKLLPYFRLAQTHSSIKKILNARIWYWGWNYRSWLVCGPSTRQKLEWAQPFRALSTCPCVWAHCGLLSEELSPKQSSSRISLQLYTFRFRRAANRRICNFKYFPWNLHLGGLSHNSILYLMSFLPRAFSSDFQFNILLYVHGVGREGKREREGDFCFLLYSFLYFLWNYNKKNSYENGTY